MTTFFTPKQKLFIDYYLQTLNGVESARLAGYKGEYHTLGVVAHDNLKLPKIREAIESRLEEAAISANETLARVSKHATGTMSDFLELQPSDDGKFTVLLDIKKAERSGKLDLIKKYKETETRIVNKFGRETVTVRREIELYPADAALDKLMRYHALYGPKGTEEDPLHVASKVRFIDYGLEEKNNDDTD